MDSLKMFFVSIVICASVSLSLTFTIDVLENRDIIFPRRSDLVKRTASNDVSELNQQKISLASFIENIETGILQTALSVDPLASDAHVEVQNVTTEHPVEKRSTVEKNNGGIESSTPLVLVQTTENVPAVDAVPSHVVIDRVSVFKAPGVGSGLFPTFLVQETNTSGDATEVSLEADEEQSIPTTTNSDSSKSEESTESNESSESSDEKSKKSKVASTTEKQSSSSTSSPSSSSTTPLSVEEKKNVEKELKEKVGEVEAEPVIFTARV